MATIKSFTSLEQSKILAKILPIESADMYYHPYPNDEDWYDIPNLGEANLKYNQLPCWSLSSLLNVLPANKLEKQFDGKWWFSVYLPSGQHKSHKHDNPIDACVEVILNLHKLNLL